MRHAALGSVVAAAGLLALAGCGGGDPIRSYTVPRPTQPTKAREPEPAPGEGVRMLGAVIPAGEGRHYFVRFLGPVAKIDPHEKAFDQFVASIRTTTDEKNPLTYTAPEGWKPGGARQMRVVTFLAGDAEVYVSTPLGGTVLENVNRWRTDFVGLPKVTAADLPGVMKEVKLGDVTAYQIDFRGPGGKGGKMGPFMGGR